MTNKDNGTGDYDKKTYVLRRCLQFTCISFDTFKDLASGGEFNMMD